MGRACGCRGRCLCGQAAGGHQRFQTAKRRGPGSSVPQNPGSRACRDRHRWTWTTIDGLNIYHATHAAMCEAVKKLACVPSAVLVDGNRYPKFDMPAEALVGGDALSISIAAASIIAKVTRDRIMRELALRLPCCTAGSATRATARGSTPTRSGCTASPATTGAVSGPYGSRRCWRARKTRRDRGWRKVCFLFSILPSMLRACSQRCTSTYLTALAWSRYA